MGGWKRLWIVSWIPAAVILFFYFPFEPSKISEYGIYNDWLNNTYEIISIDRCNRGHPSKSKGLTAKEKELLREAMNDESNSKPISTSDLIRKIENMPESEYEKCLDKVLFEMKGYGVEAEYNREYIYKVQSENIDDSSKFLTVNERYENSINEFFSHKIYEVSKYMFSLFLVMILIYLSGLLVGWVVRGFKHS